MALLDEVSKATARLLMNEPFYGHFAVRLVKHEAPSGTMGIALAGSSSVLLRVNAGYWLQTLTTVDQRQGALKHQLLHLAFGHPFSQRRFGNTEVFWVAADLVVNQYLLAKQVAPDASTLAQYALPPDRDVAFYYAALLALLNSATHGTARAELVAAMARASGSGEHGAWREASALEEGERAILEAELDALIGESARRTAVGALPALLQQRLQEIEERLSPAADWKRVMRIFSQTSRVTSVHNTIKRASRRYGTVPGTRIRRRSKLLVAIDTSGSISDAELAHFFVEIHRLWEQRAEIWVTECDSKIIRTRLYTGKRPDAVGGRGGTCFDPPLVLARELRVDGVIYFTDAHGPKVEVELRRVPLLWVIAPTGASEGSEEIERLPGRKVKMHRTTADG